MNAYYSSLKVDSVRGGKKKRKKKKAGGLIEGSLKSCKFGLCEVILRNYLLKSLCTFPCENCRAEPLKCVSDKSDLNVVRRILQLAPEEARDVVQSERISALGV